MAEISRKIVVLGVGNILLTDEGVGVRIVQELEKRFTFPDDVRLVDGGTQGLWLMSTIEQAEHLIVVDTVLGPGEPGALYRLEREDLPSNLRVKTSAHDSDLIEALNLCKMIDLEPKTVVVLGVHPLDIVSQGLELTPTVEARVEDLVSGVLDELKKLGVTAQKKI